MSDLSEMPSLFEQIETDLIAAMKSGNTDQTAVLRLLKSSLKNEQIKLGHELSDAEVLKVLGREAKQRKDSITAYRDGGREEMAQAEQKELELIETYLPEQISEAELIAIIDKVIAETGAKDPSQMGVVIGNVMTTAMGQADGAVVSRLVKERLVGGQKTD